MCGLRGFPICGGLHGFPNAKVVLYYPIAEVVLYVRASLLSDCRGGAIRAGFVVSWLGRMHRGGFLA